MIYVSSPFTHSDAEIQNDRVHKTGKFVASLLQNDTTAISPVLYGLAILPHMSSDDTTWAAWSRMCEDILKKCDSMIVLGMDGWDKSRGVTEEIELAKSFGIPIAYVPLDESY